MILEVVRADGARSWHRLGALPLTVGRALSNDLILDDPYVDARHARIALDEGGALLIEDLGSVNGLVTDDATRNGRVAVRPGVHVRVGRTTLRFRDPEEPVAQALVDDAPSAPRPVRQPEVVPAAATATAPAAARGPTAWLPRWAATTPGRLALATVTMGAFALYTWLGNSTRSSANDVFTSALAFAMVASLWAGLWAVASRIIVHRFHFVGHVAVASAAALAGLGTTILTEWLAFYFPDSTLADALPSALSFAVVAALIAGHLALSSHMAGRKRWRTGLLVAATFYAVGGLATLVKDETFSDVPKFSGVLKPVTPALVPTMTVDDFGAVMRELKTEADELAAEQAKDSSAAGATSGLAGE